METNQNYDKVFISYRRKDARYAAVLLKNDLIEHGFSVFFDASNIRTGRFPEIIQNSLEHCVDFVFIVSPETFSSRFFEPGDWVHHELATAIRLNKNIVVVNIGDSVLPAKEKLPDDVKDIVDYNYISQIDVNILKETNEKLMKEYLVSKPLSKIQTEYAKRQCSAYDATYGDEFKRLEIQSQHWKDYDCKLINKATNGKKEMVVLDVGCSYGYVGHDRFNQDNSKLVIGVDKNETCLDFARQHFSDGIHHYETLDVESPDFEMSLNEILQKYNIPGFDFIFLSLVLHHLKDQLKVLVKLKKYLVPGGTIFLRTPDDGFKKCYPDDANLMNEIIEMTMKVPGVSDRINGRKAYSLLRKSGFRNIHVTAGIQDTSGMDYDQKFSLFQESFSYRLDYFRKAYEAQPQNEERRTEFERMETNLAAFEEKFYDDDFWYTEFDFYAFGNK